VPIFNLKNVNEHAVAQCRQVWMDDLLWIQEQGQPPTWMESGSGMNTIFSCGMRFRCTHQMTTMKRRKSFPTAVVGVGWGLPHAGDNNFLAAKR
jgi:hypothetical protein